MSVRFEYKRLLKVGYYNTVRMRRPGGLGNRNPWRELFTRECAPSGNNLVQCTAVIQRNCALGGLAQICNDNITYCEIFIQCGVSIFSTNKLKMIEKNEFLNSRPRVNLHSNLDMMCYIIGRSMTRILFIKFQNRSTSLIFRACHPTSIFAI